MSLINDIFKVISKSLNISEEAISVDTLLEDDLGADSLDIMELFLNIEEAFQIEIPDEDMFEILTVGDLVKYLELHL